MIPTYQGQSKGVKSFSDFFSIPRQPTGSTPSLLSIDDPFSRSTTPGDGTMAGGGRPEGPAVSAYGLGDGYIWSAFDSPFAAYNNTLVYCDGSRVVIPVNAYDSYRLPELYPEAGEFSFDFYVPAIADTLSLVPAYGMWFVPRLWDTVGGTTAVWPSIYVFSNGDGTWQIGAYDSGLNPVGASPTGSFTPDEEVMYRCTLDYDAATSICQYKVWKVGDTEPDWMFSGVSEVSFDTANVPFGYPGNGPYLGGTVLIDFWEGSTTVDCFFDNLLVPVAASSPTSGVGKAYDVPRYEGLSQQIFTTGKSPSDMDLTQQDKIAPVAQGQALPPPIYSGLSKPIHVFGEDDNPSHHRPPPPGLIAGCIPVAQIGTIPAVLTPQGSDIAQHDSGSASGGVITAAFDSPTIPGPGGGGSSGALNAQLAAAWTFDPDEFQFKGHLSSHATLGLSPEPLPENDSEIDVYSTTQIYLTLVPLGSSPEHFFYVQLAEQRNNIGTNIVPRHWGLSLFHKVVWGAGSQGVDSGGSTGLAYDGSDYAGTGGGPVEADFILDRSVSRGTMQFWLNGTMVDEVPTGFSWGTGPVLTGFNVDYNFAQGSFAVAHNAATEAGGFSLSNLTVCGTAVGPSIFSGVIFRPQFGDPTTTLDASVCLMESAAMALDWHTRGGLQLWGGQLVPWCGRPEAQIRVIGTSLQNARQAWAHFGQYLDIRAGQPWTSLIAALSEGRAVILAGLYGDLIDRCSSFTGSHAVVVLPYFSDGGTKVMIGDPLCPNFKYIDISDLQTYAEALGVAFYGSHSPQPVYFGVSQAWPE